MNTVKNYITTHLRLNKIDVLEVVMHLITYVIKYVFQIKTESKILAKSISCECKCKFDGRKCNSNQKWDNIKCRWECKKHHICEKEYIWNHATYSSKNGKYLATIIDDSVITCDEIIEAETKAIPKNFNEKNITCKTQNFYTLLAFLLITIALLVSVSIYCYLIEYKSKQKYSLPYYVTNDY